MLVYAITPRVFDGAAKCRSGPVGFAVGNKTGTGAGNGNGTGDVTGTRCWQRLINLIYYLINLISYLNLI